MKDFNGKFKNSFFNLLTKNLKFYMKYYFSNRFKENRWISILDLGEYYLGVIITDLEKKEVDYIESTNYLKENLNKKFIISSIILDDEDRYMNEIDPNIIVISSKRKIVTYCGNNAKGLLEPINYILNQNKTKKKYYDIGKYKFTYSLILINIIIFIIEVFISRNILDIDIYTLLFMGAKYNPLIEQGQIYRIITSCFLHGGIIHIFFNMRSLKIIGEEVEFVYGKLKYIIIYFLSGLGGGIFSFIFNKNSLSVGASGAIFGLLGAMLVYGLLNRDKIGKDYIRSISETIIINIILGITISVIDNSAHIGGLIFGAITSLILYKIN